MKNDSVKNNITRKMSYETSAFSDIRGIYDMLTENIHGEDMWDELIWDIHVIANYECLARGIR